METATIDLEIVERAQGKAGNDGALGKIILRCTRGIELLSDAAPCPMCSAPCVRSLAIWEGSAGGTQVEVADVPSHRCTACDLELFPPEIALALLHHSIEAAKQRHDDEAHRQFALEYNHIMRSQVSPDLAKSA